MTTKTARSQTSQIILALLWPRLFFLVCGYCSGRSARGGLDIDGDYFHSSCHRDACR